MQTIRRPINDTSKKQEAMCNIHDCVKPMINEGYTNKQIIGYSYAMLQEDFFLE
jgi:hypothetical protein